MVGISNWEVIVNTFLIELLCILVIRKSGEFRESMRQWWAAQVLKYICRILLSVESLPFSANKL